MRERMRDAAFASNIDTAWANADHDRIIGGYLTRPPGDAFHPWSKADWGRFPHNKKLPIMVQSNPGTAGGGESDGLLTIEHLYQLGARPGVYTALDLETAVDPAYVTAYGKVLRFFRYKVLVYGSSGFVFNNPPLDGYWVAAPSSDGKPYEFNHPEVVATQYALDVSPGYDSSAVRWSTQLGQWWV